MSQARRELAAGYLTTLRSIMDEAQRTDYIMPIWLPFLPAILSVVLSILALLSMIVTIGAGMGMSRGGVAFQMTAEEAAALAVLGVFLVYLFIVLGIAAVILGVYVMYKWIKRRNEHFARSHRFYENVLNFLEAMGYTDPEIAAMKNMVQEMKYRETPRNPIVWIVLSYLTGIVALYVYHFLTRDFYEHEKREQTLNQRLRELLARYNIPLQAELDTVPDRNTILYIVLSIITLGLFLLYWYYVITKDPNEHFIQHRRVENEIYTALYNIYTAAAQP